MLNATILKLDDEGRKLFENATSYDPASMTAEQWLWAYHQYQEPDEEEE